MQYETETPKRSSMYYIEAPDFLLYTIIFEM